MGRCCEEIFRCGKNNLRSACIQRINPFCKKEGFIFMGIEIVKNGKSCHLIEKVV